MVSTGDILRFFFGQNQNGVARSARQIEPDTDAALGYLATGRIRYTAYTCIDLVRRMAASTFARISRLKAHAGPPAYQVPESALNALTRTLPGELRDRARRSRAAVR